MLNKYPLWKNLLILVVVALAFIYAAPNLYPPDAAIQVTPARAGAEMSSVTLNNVREALDDAGISYFGEEVNGSTALLRLESADAQLPAKAAIQRKLGDEFVVALNLAPTTPDWLVNLGAGPMTLGLDLSGGVHFLMEVDMDEYVSGRITNYREDLRTSLRQEDIKYRRVVVEGTKVRLSFRQEALRSEARTFINRNYPGEFLPQEEDVDGNFDLILMLTEQKVRDFEDYALKQNLMTLRNRVNELGVAEPLVQRQGRNRIVVELPGVQDTAEAKKILGKAANLEFRLEAEPGASRFATEEYSFRDNQNRTARLEKKVITTGDSVTNASSGFDENSFPQ
ncbi:MAG: protein translocase subunit SecD, partial [Pseudomonadota bacterium]|nr:protein translocase subunit SecD [Pseudomonadota bacterium]